MSIIGRTNSGSGGGGGLSPNNAVIHVNAPVGSSISLSKGGVVVKVIDSSKSHISSANANYADYYYAVSSNNYGSWSMQASLGTEVSTVETITINSNKQYDVALDYTFWLYKEGNEYTNRTGGWEVKWEKSKRASKEATYLNLTSAESNGQCISTINKVNLTNFSNFCMEMPVASTGNSKYHNMLVWADNSSATSASTVANWEFGNIAAGVYRLSIASVSGPRKLGFRSWNGANFRVSKVWLE